MTHRSNSVARVDLDADLSQVAMARSFVRGELDGVAAGVTADIQLIVSELVTNAFEHGSGSTVSVQLQTDRRGVAVTVDSAGRPGDVGAVDGWEITDPDVVGGRGLGIVRAVADSVEVGGRPGRLTVTARCDF